MPPRRRLFLALLAVPLLAVLLLYLAARPATDASKLPDEIFGLLHFVTSPDEAGRVIVTPDSPVGDNGTTVVPERPVEMSWYALGATTKAGERVLPKGRRPAVSAASEWEARLTTLRDEFPLVVFSKSYCPYSQRAKWLLETYDLSPAPKIIQVDLRADASHIKTVLTRLTHHSTFPNVILRGQSLGGSDELERLHQEGRLRELLEEGGVAVGHARSL